MDHILTEQVTCGKEEVNSNNEGASMETIEVIKQEKRTSDSDTNSEYSNDEQNNVNSNNSSQFYESSDSKIDYAVKLDDNENTLSDIDDIKTDSASADSEDSALGSLPPDSTPNEGEDEVQDRSDGSDSGIGSETTEEAKLSTFNLDHPCTSGTSYKTSEHNLAEKPPLQNNSSLEYNFRLNEKVKTPIKSSLKRKHEDNINDGVATKKVKKSIKFDDITVYYFPRAQGFSCVPSQGGSTLGMEWQHAYIQKFSLAEHAMEQRRLHRQILQQLKSERHTMQGVSLSSSEDSDTEEEASDISESELDLDSYYFLQPVPTRQRRALLRAAGVRKIEGYEKDECRDIRTSREFCGCACKGICNPENCSCSMGGIKCQIDRLNFPCGCTRDGCGNTTGRIEFNPVRVRTHFIHTLMRLGLEKKNEENQEAIKRQWAESQNPNASQCIPNTSYERDRCLNHDDGLLRDVSLTPRVEVETCVNSGSFSNIHCDMNMTSQSNNMPEDVAYNYDSRNNIMNDNNVLRYEETNIQNVHAESYTSNILQGKGPPYPTNNARFEAMTNNLQRYPCDLNYVYSQPAVIDNNNFKGIQSFSASSFEEFAHNSQMSMFSHYGHMYVSEYLPKPSTNMQDHNSLQYESMQQNHYNMYKSTSSDCMNTDDKSDYSTLMTSPYHNANKFQTVEKEETWLSHNTLLNLDNSDQTQDGSDLQSQGVTEPPSEIIEPEATENFGELIKKTMVESVIV